MEQKQNIRVRIDNVVIRMVVHSEDEEKRYRDAAAYVNDRMLNLRQKYPTVPSDNYYAAILLLELATKGVDISNNTSVEPYKKSIAELRAEIQEALAEVQP